MEQAMSQAKPVLSPSAALLPVNELPKPPTLAEELAKALEDDVFDSNVRPARNRKSRKQPRGRQ
jgi:hypothetical protein